MKRALLLMLLCAVPAHATTLTIDNGSAYMDGIGTFWDTCFVTSGLGINPTCNGVPFFSLPLDGADFSRNYVPRALIDGTSYQGPAPTALIPFPDNLRMSFTYEPIPDVPWPPFVDGAYVFPERATSPFTMTGTLALFDPAGSPVTFDLQGQGTLERFWRPEGTFGTPFLRVQFNFEPLTTEAVPEPASVVLLLCGGLIGLLSMSAKR